MHILIYSRYIYTYLLEKITAYLGKMHGKTELGLKSYSHDIHLVKYGQNGSSRAIRGDANVNVDQ